MVAGSFADSPSATIPTWESSHDNFDAGSSPASSSSTSSLTVTAFLFSKNKKLTESEVGMWRDMRKVDKMYKAKLRKDKHSPGNSTYSNNSPRAPSRSSSRAASLANSPVMNSPGHPSVSPPPIQPNPSVSTSHSTPSSPRPFAASSPRQPSKFPTPLGVISSKIATSPVVPFPSPSIGGDSSRVDSPGSTDSTDGADKFVGDEGSQKDYKFWTEVVIPRWDVVRS